jgi:hypothetical protein
VSRLLRARRAESSTLIYRSGVKNLELGFHRADALCGMMPGS